MKSSIHIIERGEIMNKILARCERTNEFEEWNSYIKDDTGMRVNKVLVFFMMIVSRFLYCRLKRKI